MQGGGREVREKMRLCRSNRIKAVGVTDSARDGQRYKGQALTTWQRYGYLKAGNDRESSRQKVGVKLLRRQ